mmetsp:Transcript_20968/g.30233  ORF Transcript_20968/g.30233 Transcript_20968/m.30233 type:complete len:669 (-) Transcript_20968:229-2235(-)
MNQCSPTVLRCPFIDKAVEKVPSGLLNLSVTDLLSAFNDPEGNIIVTILDPSDNVAYISPIIENILGCSSSSLIGSKNYSTYETGCCYFRVDKDGYDIQMEVLSCKVLPSGHTVMLERIVKRYKSDSPKPLTPSAAVHDLSSDVLTDFVENASVGIHWVRGDGIIAWANRADMAICGYDADKYIGSNVVDYHADADVIADILNRLGSRQTLKEYRARLRHKDGSIRHVVIDSSANFDSNGQFINTRCFTRDVTDVYEAQQLKQEAELQALHQAMEMKTTFLARMSHDIRTPLNGVLGMAILLQGTQLSPEQSEFVNIIESSSSFLCSLLGDILDHTKMEAGKIDFNCIPFSASKAVRECVKTLSYEAAKKDITVNIVMNIPNGLEDALYMGDPNRFKQIVLNFLSNAIKFTSEGTVTVSLTVTPLPPGARVSQSNQVDEVRVQVTDEGIGIKDVSKLFSPFVQATRCTGAEYGGTGLGLSIAKNLTQLMGGKIDIRSELGGGTTIWSTIPFSRLPASSSLNAVSDTQDAVVNEKEWRKHCRVLIVEDNKVNQKVLSHMLKRLEFQHIEISENGQDAVNVVQRYMDENVMFDIILMDCLMPVMDGLSATKMIRNMELCRGTPRTAIVALTANAAANDKDDCMSSGMDDFLTKPLQIDRLSEVMRLWAKK